MIDSTKDYLLLWLMSILFMAFVLVFLVIIPGYLICHVHALAWLRF